jgi:hypothetical protein
MADIVSTADFMSAQKLQQLNDIRWAMQPLDVAGVYGDNRAIGKLVPMKYDWQAAEAAITDTS